MDFKRRCKELSKYLYCLCHKCPLHFSMSVHQKKSFPSCIFYSPLSISSSSGRVVHRVLVLKGLDRAESSDIHGFVAHAWDVKCPSIRKMGASLWISDVIFFSSYPFFFMLHLWAVCQNSEMPLATLKAQIWIFLLLSIPQNTLGILLPQMKDMSTNRSQRVRRQAGRGGSGKSIT